MTCMEMKDQQPASHTPDSAKTVEAPLPEDTVGLQNNGTEGASSAAAEDAPATLEEQLTQQRLQAAEYLDHLQRLQAEFNNYRRRANQERLQAASRGKEDVLRALFPILSNLHLALRHADQDANAVRQGVQMIWQQFEGFLRDQGVERITTVGQTFDPAQHEAVSTVPATAGTLANTIVSEVNAGYRLEDRLLRPAQVVVARPAEAATAAESPPAPSSVNTEA
jgi:molecular chaperone GrpE